MWPYFGGKSRLAHLYPYPRYPHIIEPFAGAAGYARHYARDHRVTLIDRDVMIVHVWEWLQSSSVREIESLPRLQPGDPVPNDIPLEAQWFLGWMYNAGSDRPRNFAGNYSGRFTSAWWRVWRLAKSWQIVHGNYWEAPDVVATWFVDPPYQSRGAGNRYKYSTVDYDHLREWVLTRKGQVIVCDGESAEWLPFTTLTYERGQRQQLTDRYEMIWTVKRQNVGKR